MVVKDDVAKNYGTYIVWQLYLQIALIYNIYLIIFDIFSQKYLDFFLFCDKTQLVTHFGRSQVTTADKE